MARVTDPVTLVAALGLYFGGGPAAGHRADSMTDGPGRVREADPARADGLIAEIETLWRTASSLPGLWGEHALPLEEACERVDRARELARINRASHAGDRGSNQPAGGPVGLGSDGEVVVDRARDLRDRALLRLESLAGILDLNREDNVPRRAGKGDDSGVVRDQTAERPRLVSDLCSCR